MGAASAKHPPVSEPRPQVGVLTGAGQTASGEPLAGRYATPSSRDSAFGERRSEETGLWRDDDRRDVAVGVSADRQSARYGSSGDATDSSSSYSSPCTSGAALRVGGASIARSSSSRELFRSARDGTVLDYLGCRQVSVLPMDTPKSPGVGVGATPTPKNTLSKATGLSLSMAPSSDKKALESTDGNWMLKSEALAEAEKARVRSLHARNIVVSNKLSEAIQAEDSKRQTDGADVDRSLSASDVPSPVHSPSSIKVPRQHQFHSLTARAYSGNHGVRVESPPRPSILARDDLGNLFLVPVLDAASPGVPGSRILSRTSSGSSPSPGSAVYPQNEAFVFSVASPHSSSTPDLLQAATLSPYVAKVSRQASYDTSSQTLPRKLNEPSHKVRSPDLATASTDHLYSTMPRSTGGVKDDGRNIYRGAVVRVQVPGHSPKYLKHSQSVDAENSMARRAQYTERRSKSTEHERTRGNVSSSHLKYIDAEVHIDGKTDSKTEKKHKKTRNKSTGALADNDTRKTSEKSTNEVSR